MKESPQNRRQFIATTASLAATAAIAMHTSSAAANVSTSANDQITVGVMGVNGRGNSLARGFAQRPNTVVTHLCDVDSRALDRAAESLAEVQKAPVKTVGDFREMLDDKSVDVLVCAAPNHWHAPATILGCAAGKHVYVEKPCSHTAREGELAVEAARKNDRVVQMGTQRRSTPLHAEAIQKLHAGVIGNVLFARAWYNNRRGSIGVGKATEIPAWLNYELWQGPVTERAYKSNLLHYNWHWHWHYGNGELGNNGVHAIDVARWGLQVDYPTQVTSAGGKYRWVDDQETADTHIVSYEFGDRMITWEGLSWSPRDASGSQFGISFHGDAGQLLLLDSGYTIFDIQNKQIEEKAGGVSQDEHFDSFLGCIRNGGRPTADIEEAHKSTLLCHLGNIALRTRSSLNIDPANGHIIDNDAAAAHWTKEYRPGWEPKV
jgi:predicted dehydrogenase